MAALKGLGGRKEIRHAAKAKMTIGSLVGLGNGLLLTAALRIVNNKPKPKPGTLQFSHLRRDFMAAFAARQVQRKLSQGRSSRRNPIAASLEWQPNHVAVPLHR